VTHLIRKRLRRWEDRNTWRFLACSCKQRRPFFDEPAVKDLFVEASAGGTAARGRTAGGLGHLLVVPPVAVGSAASTCGPPTPVHLQAGVGRCVATVQYLLLDLRVRAQRSLADDTPSKVRGRTWIVFSRESTFRTTGTGPQKSRGPSSRPVRACFSESKVSVGIRPRCVALASMEQGVAPKPARGADRQYVAELGIAAPMDGRESL